MTNETERMSDRELSELVAQALSAPDDRVLWDKAARQIILLVEEKAPALNFSARVLQDVKEAGVSHLFEQVRAGKWNPLGGHFRGWAWRVLKNVGLQAARTAQNRRVNLHYDPVSRLNEVPDPRSARQPWGSHEQWTWEEASQHCRKLLDEVAADLVQHEGRVNYFAVFLLELRRAVTTSFAKALHRPADGDIADYAADYLPWHAYERKLSIREQYATLGQIWDIVVERLSERDLVLQMPEMCELISSLAQDPSSSLTVANMTKLSQRARHHVCERMDPQQWETWFAHWWPRRL